MQVDNSFGDLIYSFTPIQNDRQYFWEAFPSQDLHGSKVPLSPSQNIYRSPKY